MSRTDSLKTLTAIVRMTPDRHDAALSLEPRARLLGDLLDEEVFERVANGIERHELRASADQIAQQQLGRRLERQLERVALLAERRRALHARHDDARATSAVRPLTISSQPLMSNA